MVKELLGGSYDILMDSSRWVLIATCWGSYKKIWMESSERDCDGDLLKLCDRNFDGLYKGDFDGILLGLVEGDLNGLVQGDCDGDKLGLFNEDFSGSSKGISMATCGALERRFGWTLRWGYGDKLGLFDRDFDGLFKVDFDGSLLGLLEGDFDGQRRHSNKEGKMSEISNISN
jgi:hypothetical protein